MNGETSAVTDKTREYSDEARSRIRQIGVYTVAFVIVLVVLAIATRLYLTRFDSLTKMVIYIACSGGLGGLSYSIYGYTRHLLANDFDPNAFWWYILRPFIGILYGSFAFFFVAGGLMTLSGTGQPTSDGFFTTKSVMFYCAIAFLTGYSESSFTAQLKELAEAVFKRAEPTGTKPPGGLNKTQTPDPDTDPNKPQGS